MQCHRACYRAGYRESNNAVTERMANATEKTTERQMLYQTSEREKGSHTNRRTQHRGSASTRDDYDKDGDDEDEECCSVAIVAQETSGRYSCTALGTA